MASQAYAQWVAQVKANGGRVAESPRKSVAAARNNVGPDIDLNCVIDHIQNPPESFQYSFKAASDNPWEEQADVTPQRIAGSFSNKSLSTPQHFDGSPREVSSNLMAIGRMASLFAIVRNTWFTTCQKRKSAGEVCSYDDLHENQPLPAWHDGQDSPEQCELFGIVDSTFIRKH